MALDETKVNEFIQKIRDVLDRKADSAYLEFEASTDELKRRIEEVFGERKKELFLLTTTRDKKQWPDQKADFESTMKVVRQEDKFKA